MTPLEAVQKIRELANGRRHYDGTDGYTCFEALGDVRAICDEVLLEGKMLRHYRSDLRVLCGSEIAADLAGSIDVGLIFMGVKRLREGDCQRCRDEAPKYLRDC